MTESVSISFPAEIIEVKVKRLASGDKTIRVVLETFAPQAIALQEFIGESAVVLEVKRDE